MPVNALPASLRLKAALQAAAPLIAPSILQCDYGHLAAEIQKLEQAGAKLIHLDVMDGDFVPNFTFGMTIVAAVRQATELPLDVHLMMQRPDRYLQHFREAGADILTVHQEVTRDAAELSDWLDTIHDLGALAGVAINPPTPLAAIDPVAAKCDLILAMSVMPGFGGQPFDRVALEKLRQLRKNPEVDALLEIDGGVNLDTIAECADAGADLLVVGSAISSGENYTERMQMLIQAMPPQ